jgi:hypothetical protein
MMQITDKIKASIREDGYVATVRRAALAIPARLEVYRSRARFQADILPCETHEERFTRIYKTNYWKGDDSKSGTGSSVEYTANLRAQLPELFERFSIMSVLDAPCGDLNWMKELIAATSINYIGCDIVEPLVQQLSNNYSSETVRFLYLDITKDPLPEADLMICRDCLPHLSYADTQAVLVNFVSSGIPYLLTSTYTDGTFRNHDIATGDYRRTDLYSAPYNFPGDPVAIIEDWIPPYPERTMCLWTRDQISAALET